MKRIGLYPGTFDPVTLGHLDVIRRARHMVDELVIGVASNEGKGPLFDVAERVAMIESEVAGMPAGDRDAVVKVREFSTLLVFFARDVGASVIFRGLRAVSDFEYEFQMVTMNRALDEGIDTVFLMADAEHQAIASRLVKEIARLGGDVSTFVTPAVHAALRTRHAETG